MISVGIILALGIFILSFVQKENNNDLVLKQAR